MKIIVTILVFLVIGCGHIYVPQKIHVDQISWLTVGDCCVKARKGQVLFARYGVKSRLCCGFVGVTGNPHAHCWNEVWCDEDKKWHLIDLSSTSNNDGWPRDQYYEYITQTYWDGVPSVEEIKNDQNADWRSTVPVLELIGRLPVGK